MHICRVRANNRASHAQSEIAAQTSSLTKNHRGSSVCEFVLLHAYVVAIHPQLVAQLLRIAVVHAEELAPTLTCNRIPSDLHAEHLSPFFPRISVGYLPLSQGKWKKHPVWLHESDHSAAVSSGLWPIEVAVVSGGVGPPKWVD